VSSANSSGHLEHLEACRERHAINIYGDEMGANSSGHLEHLEACRERHAINIYGDEMVRLGEKK
jgi:hypothetical protein